jgi:transcriptional pleiotropic regulator of transition state genes
MKNIFTRTIDELGRIVIPGEIRSGFGWGERDTLSFQCVDSNTLMLKLSKKYLGQKCVFCGATTTVTTIKEKDVCGGCLEEIKAN